MITVLFLNLEFSFLLWHYWAVGNATGKFKERNGVAQWLFTGWRRCCPSPNPCKRGQIWFPEMCTVSHSQQIILIGWETFESGTFQLHCPLLHNVTVRMSTVNSKKYNNHTEIFQLGFTNRNYPVNQLENSFWHWNSDQQFSGF